MKRNLWLLSSVAALASSLTAYACTSSGKAPRPAPGLTQYVDPYIGTGFHGHVFLGANVPFGAVQLGPVNLSEGWDWCSGYHYSDSTIVGFSHTHLSGTGIGDLGDVAVMPTTGAVRVRKGTLKNPDQGFVSLFSHKEERVRPGYYSVRLKRYNIKAELTATKRVGFHQYTFPKSDAAHLVIDLQQGIGWDLATDTHIEQLNDSTLVGYRYSKGWAANQRLYFAAILSKRIRQFTSLQVTDSLGNTTPAAKGNRLKGVVTFATTAGEIVKLKVGISPVSTTNAIANIRAEIPGWNFGKVVAGADAAWNQELQKVRIQAEPARMKTFYTALYHTMVAPSTFNDSNGDYWGTDQQVHKGAKFTNLTTFSLWDTYRAAHPLFTLLQPQRVNDMVSTMLAIYQQQGKLPVWHLMANETNCMVGYSAVPVVVDAYLKGFKGFDANLAYEAIKTTAMRDEFGLKSVKELGFIPADSEVENVSKGLEYAVDDWCIAQMAKKMGKTEDYAYFSKRAKNYQNYFDKRVGFMRGRVSQTEWRTPFSPFSSVHMKSDFTEGNAWQYTWLVPQDVEGLIGLLGGEKRFSQKLDSLFTVKGDMGAEASPDISGLIGMYAHGNEPGHHITYLYSYVGQPWKTAEKVRFITENFYTTKSDGIIGNEDVGQMSAWHVFSTLGFYPLNPANGTYIFGSPSVNQAIMTLAGGKTLTIEAKNNSSANKYIQRIALNGKPYTKSYITHQDLLQGGKLVFEMGDKPSPTWGVGVADRPRSVMQ
ncbi:MAG: GH92 family glycosyl hydrolase [Janthinobacterium lividum]